MGFKQDARFVKIWEVENKGNYHIVSLSTSKRNKETKEYETDFKHKFVRFIGTAHKLANDLKVGDVIKLGSCEVTNKYDKEKGVEYTNYLVYSFEKENNGVNTNQPMSKSDGNFMTISDEPDDLPFN